MPTPHTLTRTLTASLIAATCGPTLAADYGGSGYVTPGYGNPTYGSGTYGNGGYGNPVYRDPGGAQPGYGSGGGYGNAASPFPRGFSDVGEAGWINDEPQFRPLDSSRSRTPSGYRPLDPPDAPMRGTYPSPGTTPGYRAVPGSGYGSGGYGPGDYGQAGYGASNYAPDGYGGGSYPGGNYGVGRHDGGYRSGYPSAGYDAERYGSGAYGSGAYGPGAYGSGAYGPGAYGPGASAPGDYGAGTYGTDNSGRPGYRSSPAYPGDSGAGADRYGPSGRYADAYTPPPVIDWARALPKPDVSMEDFPFNFNLGEGLGRTTPRRDVEPSLPYQLPYRSRSLPPADGGATPAPRMPGAANAPSLMDNLLGKGASGPSAAPSASSGMTPAPADIAIPPEYAAPPAPPRDPRPERTPSAPSWTPPGHDDFRPLTSEERQDWEAGGYRRGGVPDAARAGDAAPQRYFLPPAEGFSRRLEESARAFEQRMGTSDDAPTRAPADHGTPVQSSQPMILLSPAPPSTPRPDAAPVDGRFRPEPGPSAPVAPLDGASDSAPDTAPVSHPQSGSVPAGVPQEPSPTAPSGPPGDADGFRPATDDPIVPDTLPPRVESRAETG